MKKKRRNSSNLTDLFMKELRKENLPKRDVGAFLKEREARKKLEMEADKLQHRIEEIEAPIYEAQAVRAGLNLDTLLEIQKKRNEVLQKFRQEHKNPDIGKIMEMVYPESYEPKLYVGTHLGSTPSELLEQMTVCKDIAVRICKEKICVEQEMHSTVDDIYLEGDGSLNRIGDDRFEAEDSVGYATEQTQTHEGKITILSGVTLVEPTTVLGVGFDLEHPRDANGELIGNNSLCGWGHNPWIGASHWGRAKGYYKIKWFYKEPGGTWTNNYTSDKIKYWDEKKDSYIMCWAVNVLGQAERARVHLTRYKVLPAETEVLSELNLYYWIKSYKLEGHAWAKYSLKVKPYINIHACSYDYPESICINISDWT